MAVLVDLNQYVGADLGVSATGDLLSVDGSTRTTQRLLRRMLTNAADGDQPPDYIFHPDYGAGLPRRVGDVINIEEITAVIRGQVLLEASVSNVPEPEIIIEQLFDGISVLINYTDADTKTPQTLQFEVSR